MKNSDTYITIHQELKKLSWKCDWERDRDTVVAYQFIQWLVTSKRNSRYMYWFIANVFFFFVCWYTWLIGYLSAAVPLRDCCCFRFTWNIRICLFLLLLVSVIRYWQCHFMFVNCFPAIYAEQFPMQPKPTRISQTNETAKIHCRNFPFLIFLLFDYYIRVICCAVNCCRI